MDIVTLPDDAGGGALDETVRALFQLQSQALKASQAQIGALQQQMSFRESAALLSSTLYVLTGLAGYLMTEQGDPDPNTAILLVQGSFVCLFVAAVLVGRLVKDAKNKEQAQNANARGSVQMVANPANSTAAVPV